MLRPVRRVLRTTAVTTATTSGAPEDARSSECDIGDLLSEQLADLPRRTMADLRVALGKDLCRELLRGLTEEFAAVTPHGVVLPLATMTSIPPRARVYVDACDQVITKSRSSPATA